VWPQRRNLEAPCKSFDAICVAMIAVSYGRRRGSPVGNGLPTGFRGRKQSGAASGKQGIRQLSVIRINVFLKGNHSPTF
jgi:hypothetical protein